VPISQSLGDAERRGNLALVNRLGQCRRADVHNLRLAYQSLGIASPNRRSDIPAALLVS